MTPAAQTHQYINAGAELTGMYLRQRLNSETPFHPSQ